MSLDISPGSVVSVKVTRRPTNAGAAKTLSRIFLHDPVNRRSALRRKRILHQTLRMTRRGGRLWPVKSKAPRMFQPEAGDHCNVRASLYLIADLNSVSRFVDVKAK